MTSLARAEMAILRGQRAEAQSHADAATRQLPVRHAGLAARPGHQGLYQHAAGQEPASFRRSAHAFRPSRSSAAACVARRRRPSPHGTSPRRLAAAPPHRRRAPADKAALGKTIRDYLMANPEVLVEAMQELERKQDSQRDAVAQKGVQENQAELYPRSRQPDRRQSQRRRRHRRVQRLPVPLLQARPPGGEVGGRRRRQGEDRLQGPADPGRGLEDRRPRGAGLGQAGQAPRRCTTR